MSETFRKPGAAAHYDAARGMGKATLAHWMETLREFVPAAGVRRILDVGGGTGRFTGALQTAYGCPVTVVDPAEPMLAEGRRRALGNVSWVCASAESLPFPDAAFDIVWMSNVFHHLEDRPRAFKEIRRVLAPCGRLAMRNGTQETDAAIAWMQLFPEAMEVEARNIPHRADIIEAVTQAGFKLVTARVVTQQFAENYREYYDKINARGLSLLLEIPDAAFRAGLKRLRAWVAEQPQDVAVYEPVDFFVFDK